jgi:hypothetical protein
VSARNEPAPSPKGTGSDTQQAPPARSHDNPTPPRCEYAAIYCGALGILERENAGKRGICCRHYLFGFSADEAE